MEIEDDALKRETTLARRGLDFAAAGEIFNGRHVSQTDDRFDYGERRVIRVGFMGGRMVVAVWTERAGRRRMISLRKANDDEQAAFGPQLG